MSTAVPATLHPVNPFSPDSGRWDTQRGDYLQYSCEDRCQNAQARNCIFCDYVRKMERLTGHGHGKQVPLYTQSLLAMSHIQAAGTTRQLQYPGFGARATLYSALTI